jgi:large subunit ribosomal protein L23
MQYAQLLIKPLLTEKSAAMKDAARQVTFVVHPAANRIEIKKAVEALFNVKVEKVNVACRAPVNRRRQGRVTGREPGLKKAYVTLARGEKIEFFEGV